MLPHEYLVKIMKALEDILEILGQQNQNRFAEQYIDNDELLQVLKISKRTAQTWRNQGLLPYAQFGSKIYYRLSDLETMFNNAFASTEIRLKQKKYLKKKPAKKSRRKNTWVIEL